MQEGAGARSLLIAKVSIYLPNKLDFRVQFLDNAKWDFIRFYVCEALLLR